MSEQDSSDTRDVNTQRGMMSKRPKRKLKNLDQIVHLQAKRRIDIIKCVSCLVGIVVFLGGREFLISQNYIANNTTIGLISMLVAFVLAAVAGLASMDYTKRGKEIRGLCYEAGITKEDIEQYKEQHST